MIKNILFIYKNKIRRIIQILGINIKKPKIETSDKKLINFFKMIKPIKTEYKLIRLGSKFDGGYLIPDDLNEIDACFSPGVNYNADFEIALTERRIICFLADNSVEKSPISNELINFTKKHLSYYNSNDYMTLDYFIKDKYRGQKDLILQMDIEGAEYEVILSSEDELIKRFRILIIEFHGLERLLNYSGYKYINATFVKILKNFDIVHIHPNNCLLPIKVRNTVIPPIMEFTFLRKDRSTSKISNKNFPHILDTPNVPENENYTLPACWFQN
jgi:hypothetical protein